MAIKLYNVGAGLYDRHFIVKKIAESFDVKLC